MKPVYVEVITKVLITYDHCYRCRVAYGDPQISLAQGMWKYPAFIVGHKETCMGWNKDQSI